MLEFQISNVVDSFKMNIVNNGYKLIKKSYEIPPPEQGGILGMKDDVICEYYHDNICQMRDLAVYEPSVNEFNRKIEEWQEHDVVFAGMVHSHLLYQNTLSSGDIEYIIEIFNNLPKCIEKLYFPIVIPEAKQVISFVARRKNTDIIK